MIDLDGVETMLGLLAEVSDIVEICGNEYYVVPAVVLDNTVDNLKKQLAAKASQTHKDTNLVSEGELK